jgi:hypothetical protein
MAVERYTSIPTLTAALLAGGFVVRILVAFVSTLPWFSADSYGYIDQARDLLAGKWAPFFPVGYPLMIAAVTALIPSAAAAALIAVNVFLSTLTVWLVMKTAGAASQWRGAPLLAGLLVAFWPNQLNYVRFVLSEVPAGFFVALSVWLLIKRRHFAAGAALGCAVAIRTTLLPAILVAPFVTASESRPRAAWFTAGCMSPLLVLAVLSISLAGTVALGGNFGFNLDVARQSFGSRIDFSGPSDVGVREAAGRYVTDAIDHPQHFVAQRAASLSELWGPWPSGDEPRARSAPPRGALARVLIGLRLPLLLLGVASIRRSMPAHEKYLWTLVAVVTLVHVMTFSAPRFTFIMEPPLVVLAVLGVERSWMRWCERRDSNPHTLSGTRS